MRHSLTLLLAGGFVFALAGDVAAQSRTPRPFFVTIYKGLEPDAVDLADAKTRERYGEPEPIAFDSTVDGRRLFDVSFGMRSEGFATSVAYSRAEFDGDGVARGTVPHPLFFDRAREFSEPVGDLTRVEQAVHLQLGYLGEAGPLELFVFAGPSFFRVRQDVVAEVEIDEIGDPFTDVSAAPQIERRSAKVTGGHVGVDVSLWPVKTRALAIGAGVMARYSRATAELLVLENEVPSRLGGLHVAFGLRVGF